LWCDWLDPEQSQELWRLFDEWFGIPRRRFAGLRLLRRGEGVYAVGEAAVGGIDALHLRGAGLSVAVVRRAGGYRPTGRGLQVFGRWATRRVCELDDAQLGALLRGASLPWEGERGQRLLRWGGVPVGLGTVRAGQLVAQLPRNVTEHLQLAGLERLC
jgi:NOL1/NOP2/fmu family ribosome biogenesis protein